MPAGAQLGAAHTPDRSDGPPSPNATQPAQEESQRSPTQKQNERPSRRPHQPNLQQNMVPRSRACSRPLAVVVLLMVGSSLGAMMQRGLPPLDWELHEVGRPTWEGKRRVPGWRSVEGGLGKGAPSVTTSDEQGASQLGT